VTPLDYRFKRKKISFGIAYKTQGRDKDDHGPAPALSRWFATLPRITRRVLNRKKSKINLEFVGKC
jgi:hypothetical protein